MENKLAARRDTVLLTGACGFLGTHIARLLAEKGDGIIEIRLLDILPQPKSYPITDNGLKVKWYRGDIRNYSQIADAFRGVDIVIHAAAIIETGCNPDDEKMKSVNIDGTENVINACIEHSVSCLIYTATSEFCRGFDAIVNANEDDLDAMKTRATPLVLEGYSTSKGRAEELVLNANGSYLSNGTPLRTISLRPCGIYGEGDKKYVTTVLKTAKRMLGLMVRLGRTDVLIQRVYVGNVAWAHICAMNVMRGKDLTACGTSYLVTDYTAMTDNFTWMKPFMAPHKIKLLSYVYVPLILLYYFWFLLEIIVGILSPFLTIQLPFAKSELFLACTTCYYNGERAKRKLHYRPLYSSTESMKRSKDYYSKLNLKS